MLLSLVHTICSDGNQIERTLKTSLAFEDMYMLAVMRLQPIGGSRERERGWIGFGRVGKRSWSIGSDPPSLALVVPQRRLRCSTTIRLVSSPEQGGNATNSIMDNTPWPGIWV